MRWAHGQYASNLAPYSAQILHKIKVDAKKFYIDIYMVVVGKFETLKLDLVAIGLNKILL